MRITAQSVIFFIAEIIAICLFIKENQNYKSKRSAFTCMKCGTLNKTIRYKGKCVGCNRKLRMGNSSWSHAVIHRITETRKEEYGYTYNYKSYIKWSKIELTVCGVCAFILFLGIIVTSI